jgi:hypothetical protein
MTVKSIIIDSRHQHVTIRVISHKHVWFNALYSKEYIQETSVQTGTPRWRSIHVMKLQKCLAGVP